MPRKMLDSKGRPTAYAFACGDVETYDDHHGRRYTLKQQHGIYLITGFHGGISMGYKRLDKARASFRETIRASRAMEADVKR